MVAYEIPVRDERAERGTGYSFFFLLNSSAALYTSVGEGLAKVWQAIIFGAGLRIFHSFRFEFGGLLLAGSLDGFGDSSPKREFREWDTITSKYCLCNVVSTSNDNNMLGTISIGMLCTR